MCAEGPENGCVRSAKSRNGGEPPRALGDGVRDAVPKGTERHRQATKGQGEASYLEQLHKAYEPDEAWQPHKLIRVGRAAPHGSLRCRAGRGGRRQQELAQVPGHGGQDVEEEGPCDITQRHSAAAEGQVACGADVDGRRWGRGEGASKLSGA